MRLALESQLGLTVNFPHAHKNADILLILDRVIYIGLLGKVAKVVQVFHNVIDFLLPCSIVRESLKISTMVLIYLSTILLFVLVFLFVVSVFLLFTCLHLDLVFFMIPLYAHFRLISYIFCFYFKYCFL